MKKTSFLLIFFLSAIGLFLWRFCFCDVWVMAQEVAIANRYGGQLVLSTTSDPKSFNPILAKETSTTQVTSMIFEGLVKTNPYDLTVQPLLAEKWKVSKDGLVWTFTLRQDVFWSDGRLFSADDVVFTFNDLIFNDAIPNSARDIFTIEGKPLKVEKIDDFHVRFTLPVKFAPFLKSLSMEILPQHLLSEKVRQGQFAFSWGIDTPVQDIVGTGPFQLSEYVPGQRIIFRPNPFYWKKDDQGQFLPYLSKVILLILLSPEIEMLKFLEGSLDSYSLRGADYPLLKPLEEKKQFSIYDLGPDMGSSFVVFNQNPGYNSQIQKPYLQEHKLAWFSNLHFRRAIAYAVDRHRMIQIVKNGLGYPQYSALSPAVGFFYSDQVRQYHYDLDKAREELQWAGFEKNDADGFLYDPKGNRLEFSLYTNADNTERVEVAAILRKDLEDLGMKVDLQFVEFNTLVSKLTSTFDWEAVVLGLTGTLDPHFGQNVWLSSGQLHLWHPKQSAPFTEWEKKIDKIFLDAAQELREDKRKLYYDEFQKIIADEVPVVYTVLGSRLTAVRDRFGNLKPAIFGGVFHNLEEIYIK